MGHLSGTESCVYVPLPSRSKRRTSRALSRYRDGNTWVFCSKGSAVPEGYTSPVGEAVGVVWRREAVSAELWPAAVALNWSVARREIL